MKHIKRLNFVKKPIVGAIHFQTLPGFVGFSTIDKILENAYKDLLSFQSGGIDAVIFENNYDLPHQITVGPETTASMTYLITKLLPLIKVPFGISVLWNDYHSALSIAKVCRASFIRIPVFVDNVVTQYGPVYSNHRDIIDFYRRILAEDVSLFTDIQVKHSQMIDKTKPLELSARQAIKAGSNGLILTGKWTGLAPDIKKLKKIKSIYPDNPIIIGSGTGQENIQDLIKYADAFIVSTSLKNPAGFSDVNIFDQNSRISLSKVRQLVHLRNKLLNVKLNYL